MPDREKVIKGLGCCIPSRNEEERKSETWYRHQDCPYRPYANGNYGCFWELMTDALALLKEQEDEYGNGFNDAMQGKRELMYEGTDGKWHKKDW